MRRSSLVLLNDLVRSPLRLLGEMDERLRRLERQADQNPGDTSTREAYLRNVERAHGPHVAASIRHREAIKNYAKTVYAMNARLRHYQKGLGRGPQSRRSAPDSRRSFKDLNAAQRDHEQKRAELINTVGHSKENPRQFTSRAIRRELFPPGHAGDVAHMDTLAALHRHRPHGRSAYKSVSSRKPRTYTGSYGGHPTGDFHAALHDHGYHDSHNIDREAGSTITVSRRT